MLTTLEAIYQANEILKAWASEKDAFAIEFSHEDYEKADKHSKSLLGMIDGILNIFYYDGNKDKKEQLKGGILNNPKWEHDWRSEYKIKDPCVRLLKLSRELVNNVNDLDIKLFLRNIDRAEKRIFKILENCEHFQKESGVPVAINIPYPNSYREKQKAWKTEIEEKRKEPERELSDIPNTQEIEQLMTILKEKGL